MNIPGHLYYTEEHEWISIEDNTATVGITDYAQSELGDIVFVELPEVNSFTNQNEPFGTVEAVKTVADLYAPISGKIIEVNIILEDHPETVNSDPYGEGWLVKIEISDQGELEALLSNSAYLNLIE